MNRLIVGCGYLGRRAARLWTQRGDQVFAVTRSEARAAEFVDEGWRPLVADITEADAIAGALASLPPLDTVLFAVGYDRAAGRSIHEVYVAGLDKTLHALAPHLSSLRSLVYVSSTGVYGQTDGNWVTEQDRCEPTRDGGRACLEAEQRLATAPWDRWSIVLRCAGLYGPDRIPQRDALLAGRPLHVPADGYLNLVHIDDAARIATLAADQFAPPLTLNVSDGRPVLRAEYYATLARLLNAPPPRFAEPAAESAAGARAAADKRVSNERLRELLAYDWLYPDHAAGLAQCLSAR
ncbi:MAG: NAD-dependent epimerase/dehydratase family protein [Pirellulales bacterium]